MLREAGFENLADAIGSAPRLDGLDAQLREDVAAMDEPEAESEVVAS